MTSDSVALVLLGEARDGLDVEVLEPETSEITGKLLRRISVTARVREQDSEPLHNELSAAAGGGQLISDVSGTRWKVLTHSHSYRSGNGPTLHTHTADLIAQEELALELVEFEQLTVSPDRWSIQKSSGEPLLVQILTDLEGDQQERFEQVLEARRGTEGSDLYFPVTLVGIGDEAISMRFGRCLWQKLADGKVRHTIVLVSQDDDDTTFRGFNEPETTRLLEQSSRHETMLSALLEELRQAGTLDEAAVARITAAADAPPFAVRREFSRSDDVEQFFSD